MLTMTAKAPENAKYMYLYLDNTGAEIDITQYTISVGTEAAPFEPYQSKTYTAPFPETVYGGTFDWETGVLTVDKLCLTYDGSEGWITETTSAGLTTFRIGSSADKRMKNIKQQTDYDKYVFITSHFNWVRYRAPEKPEHSAFMDDTTTGRTMHLVNSAWSTVEDCTAYLAAQAAAGTPLTCVFDLGEPYTIQLTPQEILELSGVNTFFSDTGDTEVSGWSDPRSVIGSLEKRLAALEAAMVANI